MKKKTNKTPKAETSPVDTSEDLAKDAAASEGKGTEKTDSKEGKKEENAAQSSKEAGAELPPITTVDEAIKVIAELQAQLREAREKEKQANDQSLRLQADFINFRKRKEKELADHVRFANEDVFKQLIPILDNFERTLVAIEKTDNLSSIKEGIVTVNKSMKRQLSKAGLEGFDAKNKEFDSSLHEAVTAVPVEDEKMKGKVIDQLEKGYKLKDKVIRYAKVVVGE